MEQEVELGVGMVIGSAIYSLGALAAFVCAIMVLIKLFKTEGVPLGILGIFCGIYTYVWGWMKAKEQGLKKVMLIWTACIVVVFIGYGITIAALGVAAAKNPGAFDVESPTLEAPTIPE